MTLLTLVRSLVLGICTLVLAFNVDAQTTGAYKRLKFVEEFTSTTCPPCAPASLILNAAISVDKDVISVRYHVPIPVAGDPWYAANPEDANARMQFYGVNSAPTAIVGGTTSVPISAAALQSALSSVPPTSFIKIDVSQDGGKIIVKVKTDRALNNATMYFAMVSRYISWPTVPGTNGEKEFYDAMNRMFPTAAGTPIAQAATEERTYEFTPTIGAGDTWKKGRQYVAVWIQQDPGQSNEGEVLQAGLTKTATTPVDYDYPKVTALSLSVPGSRYLRVDRGADKVSEITVSNPTSAPVTAEFSISNLAVLEAAGMGAKIVPSTMAIPANGSVKTTLTVTGAGQSILIEVQPAIAASDGLGTAITSAYYLVNGGKIVNFSGLGQFGAVATQFVAQQLPTYAGTVVSMPFATEFINAYPPTIFEGAVFAFDGYWRNLRGDVLTAVEDMLKAKKGVWIQTNTGMLAAFSQFAADPSFAATRAWYKNVVGIDFARVSQRATQSGNNITLLPIPVRGVSKDPIGDGINFTGNQYDPNTWPFYAQFTDIIKKTPTSLAVPVLYYDNVADNIGMVRVNPTYGGRLVYGSVGLEICSDATSRNKLSKAVFDWILGTVISKPGLAVSLSMLNFGTVQVDASKTLTFTVSNPGALELSITDVALTGTDATTFDVVDGGPTNGNPVNIAVGASRVISVSFNPVTEKNNFGAALEFTSNASTSPVVQLRGASSTTSVATEATSETGAISMMLVGANPVTSSSTIRVSGNGRITVTVVDVSGSLVSSIFEGSINGTENVVLTAASLVSGTYSIVASNGTDRAVLTVVVVR